MLARFERSGIGQVILSVGVVFVLITIVVINMPDSNLRRDASKVTAPFADAVGLQQDWGIFSQPRTIAAYVDGRVDFANGTSRTVRITTSDWLGAYSDYRWQKYEEIIRPDSGRGYWHDYSEYIASQVRGRGRVPIRVTLIRRFAQSLPPGPGPAHGPWQEYTIYVLNLGPSS